MTAWKVPGPHPDLENAWPLSLSEGDPYAGDEALEDPGSLEIHRRLRGGSALSSDEFTRQDALFLQVYRDVLEGRRPLGAAAAQARILSLAYPITHDTRPPLTGPMVATDEILADIVSNLIPDVVMTAPDRILGPFTSLGMPRRLRMVAAAVLAFAPLGPQGVRPVRRWADNDPKPPVDLRAAVRAIHMSVPMLWRVEGQHLRPLLPLSAQLLPHGPVAGLPDSPFVVGRVALGPQGATLSMGIPLVAAPPLGPLERRLELETWRMRRHEPRVTWEDLLRHRSEVLYRTLLEWSHDSCGEATIAAWQTWAASPSS